MGSGPGGRRGQSYRRARRSIPLRGRAERERLRAVWEERRVSGAGAGRPAGEGGGRRGPGSLLDPRGGPPPGSRRRAQPAAADSDPGRRAVGHTHGRRLAERARRTPIGSSREAAKTLPSLGICLHLFTFIHHQWLHVNKQAVAERGRAARADGPRPGLPGPGWAGTGLSSGGEPSPRPRPAWKRLQRPPWGEGCVVVSMDVVKPPQVPLNRDLSIPIAPAGTIRRQIIFK